MPSCRTIWYKLRNCMCCCNNKHEIEAFSEELPGRPGFEMPFRPHYQPPAPSPRTLDPRSPANRQLQQDNPSPYQSGPQTVLLVPRARPADGTAQQDPKTYTCPVFDEPDKLIVVPLQATVEDDPPTPTPKAKNPFPAMQTQIGKFQPRHRVDSHMYKPNDPRVVMSSSEEVGSADAVAVAQSPRGIAI